MFSEISLEISSETHICTARFLIFSHFFNSIFRVKIPALCVSSRSKISIIQNHPETYVSRTAHIGGKHVVRKDRRAPVPERRHYAVIAVVNRETQRAHNRRRACRVHVRRVVVGDKT